MLLTALTLEYTNLIFTAGIMALMIKPKIAITAPVRGWPSRHTAITAIIVKARKIAFATSRE